MNIRDSDCGYWYQKGLEYQKGLYQKGLEYQKGLYQKGLEYQKGLLERIEKNKCIIGGAGRDSDDEYLTFYCKFCSNSLTEEEDGKKVCPKLVSIESETTNAQYSELKKYENVIKKLHQIVIEDVPHQYQDRLLDLLTS